ncbi:MAG: undecaprenyl-diphosphate phosphatase [Armatimonadetes bacterium]|nr:undecaprenyl-diphosphate phosphatase [Armatimonadota bacterium]
MGTLEAVVYGVVQGLTEWLPISSTAHLRIVPALMGWQDPGAGFTAVIQLGTLLAVLIYFAKDLGKAIAAWAKSLTGGPSTADSRLGWAVFVGTIPIVVVGLLFQKAIKGSLRSLYVIAAMLIVIGVLMLIADKFSPQRRKLEDVTWRDGIWVGLFQAIALIPGSSRSGSTLSGGLFAGFDRATAARFSFLLSVPSVFAAGVKELVDERDHLIGPNLTPTLIATAVSFVVGYASIAFLIGYLQKRSTTVFVAYRFALALVLLGLLQSGRIGPMSGAEPADTNHVSATR